MQNIIKSSKTQNVSRYTNISDMLFDQKSSVDWKEGFHNGTNTHTHNIRTLWHCDTESAQRADLVKTLLESPWEILRLILNSNLAKESFIKWSQNYIFRARIAFFDILKILEVNCFAWIFQNLCEARKVITGHQNLFVRPPNNIKCCQVTMIKFVLFFIQFFDIDWSCDSQKVGWWVQSGTEEDNTSLDQSTWTNPRQTQIVMSWAATPTVDHRAAAVQNLAAIPIPAASVYLE